MVPETIPPTITDEQSKVSLGRQSYDMQLTVAADITLDVGVFARIPQAVKDSTRPYGTTVRLVLEIEEVAP